MDHMFVPIGMTIPRTLYIDEYIYIYQIVVAVLGKMEKILYCAKKEKYDEGVITITDDRTIYVSIHF